MARRNKRASWRKLRQLTPLIRNSLPCAHIVLRAIAKREAKHCSDPQHAINNASQNLRLVLHTYGRHVLAQTVQFVYNYKVTIYTAEPLLCIATALNENKEELALKALRFVRKHNMWLSSLPDIFLGIEKYGAETIEDGMKLAPEPSTELLDSPYQWTWKPDMVRRRWQQDYAECTAAVGIKEVNRLTKKLLLEGLHPDTVVFFVNYITRYTSRPRHLKEQRVFLALQAVKDTGLSPRNFATVVFEMVAEHRGTLAEIKEILCLAKEHSIEYVPHQEFELALKFYRQPSQRDIVLTAFQTKDLYIMANIAFCVGFEVQLAIGFDPQAKIVIARNIWNSAKREAGKRAKELMACRLPRLGIFGADIEFMYELAENPLLVPELLRQKTIQFTSITGGIDAARNIFGLDTVRQLLKNAEPGTEIEYIIALFRLGNPNQFNTLLRSLPVTAQLSLVRAINWCGLERTYQALRIINRSNIEPTLILSIARSLGAKSTIEPVIVQTIDELAILAPHHEAQLELFLHLPFFVRRRFAIAIKSYRRRLSILHSRIAYGYV